MGAGSGTRRSRLAQGAGVPAKAARPEADGTEDLMAQVQKGDMAAYRELVRCCQARVFRVIRAFHRNPEDAMEVVQDTFLKLFLARNTWEHKTSFGAWLYRIAINASIDRYRRSDKGKTVPLDDVVEGYAGTSAARSGLENPLERPPLRIRARAWLMTMRVSQVRNVLRPSNPSMPR